MVPGITATFLFARSATVLMLEFARTRKLPPSMKVMMLKSTCSILLSVWVVVPHSRSTVPLATMEIRVSELTGCQVDLQIGL